MDCTLHFIFGRLLEAKRGWAGLETSITVSSGNAGLIPSDEGEKTAASEM